MSQLSQATITQTQLTANVATYTAKNAFVAGQLVTVIDTRNKAGVFNVILRPILAAGLSALQFSVAITSPDIPAMAENVGTATSFSAPALLLLALEHGKGPFVFVDALLVLAGAYVAGGVPLDLTQLYGQVDPAGRMFNSTRPPLWFNVASKAWIAGVGQLTYKVSTFSNPANGAAALPLTPAGVAISPTSAVLQVFVDGVEHTSNPYTAAMLSDRITMKAFILDQE